MPNAATELNDPPQETNTNTCIFCTPETWGLLWRQKQSQVRLYSFLGRVISYHLAKALPHCCRQGIESSLVTDKDPNLMCFTDSSCDPSSANAPSIENPLWPSYGWSPLVMDEPTIALPRFYQGNLYCKPSHFTPFTLWKVNGVSNGLLLPLHTTSM